MKEGSRKKFHSFHKLPRTADRTELCLVSIHRAPRHFVPAVVSGKYDPAQPPRVTVSGDSVVGPYEETFDERIFGATKLCHGSVTLCSEMRFRGECIILSDSRPSLKDKGFSNRAASIKILGDCAWIVCELKNYRGFNLTLTPGE